MGTRSTLSHESAARAARLAGKGQEAKHQEGAEQAKAQRHPIDEAVTLHDAEPGARSADPESHLRESRWASVPAHEDPAALLQGACPRFTRTFEQQGAIKLQVGPHSSQA